ncbi:MAG: hypothetical protein JJ978_18430 [Roseivirga sp.]|jgi:hypothetical protein|uniref:hypothetical protein n=1 Tax=Roseivirga sp. TaxID=1964215 RepID=UPI001B1AE56F|nr:hypothetical protein [Roseivirga sp.]MBO6497550.1 hypothetical protein [Roseivirga sp.]
MNKLPLDIQIQFFKVYNNEISVADFERWLYSKKELEQLLDNDTYIDLISLNYKDRHAMHEMGKIIDPFLDFGKFEERKLKKILTDLIDRTDDFAKSLIDTYELYCLGYLFFDNLGFGYGLTFSEDFWDYSDWENLTTKQKNDRIDRIHLGVKREAELVLIWLDKEKIVPTGETNDLGHYQYIDKRTNSERKLRTVESIEIEENKEALLTTKTISKRGDSEKQNNSTFNQLWARLTGKRF